MVVSRENPPSTQQISPANLNVLVAKEISNTRQLLGREKKYSTFVVPFRPKRAIYLRMILQVGSKDPLLVAKNVPRTAS
jgi:hypothetical protein